VRGGPWRSRARRRALSSFTLSVFLLERYLLDYRFTLTTNDVSKMVMCFIVSAGLGLALYLNVLRRCFSPARLVTIGPSGANERKKPVRSEDGRNEPTKQRRQKAPEGRRNERTNAQTKRRSARRRRRVLACCVNV
jgi:hypothetical protein